MSIFPSTGSYLYVYLPFSIFLFIGLNVRLSIGLLFYLQYPSVLSFYYLYVCVPVYLLICLSICMYCTMYIISNLPSFYLFVYQPIHLSIYLSVCLSLYPIIYPSPQPAAGGVYTQLLNWIINCSKNFNKKSGPQSFQLNYFFLSYFLHTLYAKHTILLLNNQFLNNCNSKTQRTVVEEI